MQIARNAAFAPRTRRLSEELAAIRGGCVGCENCRGLCAPLMELLSLPSAVVRPD